MATRYQDDAPLGIGSPLSRVDGLSKVTGGARYAAEHPVAGLLHGVIVSGAIARGADHPIASGCGPRRAGRGGDHQPREPAHIAWFDKAYQDEVAPPGSPFRAFYDDRIIYSGQPIALVVAETFEDARHAAGLVQVEYAIEPHETDFEKSAEYKPSRTRSTFVKPKKSRRRSAGLCGCAAQDRRRLPAGDRAS